MSGVKVVQPVVQIMSAKLINNGKYERLVLLIYDGRLTHHVSCSPELARLLVRMLKQYRLSIVRLDKYESSGKWMEIREMTWLNWGDDICFNADLVPYKVALSEDFLKEVFTSCRWRPNPIVQVLEIEEITIPNNNKKRIRLLVTDGQHISYAYLSTQLALNLQNRIDRLSIIRLDVYKVNPINRNERTSITISGLTLLYKV